MAAARFDEQTGAPDIWILDITRGVSTRLTQDAAGNFFPVWSPDGTFLAFTSNREGIFDLYRVPSSGNAEAERILESKSNKLPTSWSADGQNIAFHSPGPLGDWDVWVLTLSSGSALPFAQTRFDEREAHFSPDSRWIAYASNETGRSEVYVQSFPPSGFKMRVSSEGGREPRWREDGRELFYLAADGFLMSVPVTAGKGLEAGIASPLFDTPWDSWNLANTFMYDVSSDGQRFLFACIGDDAEPAITVIFNWVP